MQKIIKMVDANIERWLLLVFYVILVSTMAIEVLRREILAYSSIWGEEIVRYAFIYIAWIGAAAGCKNRAHLRIDVLLHYLGPRTKCLVYIIGDLVMFAVGLIAFYWSFETVLVSLKFGSVSHGLRISMVFFLAAVPFGFFLILLRLLASLMRDFRDFVSGKPVFEGSQLFD